MSSGRHSPSAELLGQHSLCSQSHAESEAWTTSVLSQCMILWYVWASPLSPLTATGEHIHITQITHTHHTINSHNTSICSYIHYVHTNVQYMVKHRLQPTKLSRTPQVTFEILSTHTHTHTHARTHARHWHWHTYHCRRPTKRQMLLPGVIWPLTSVLIPTQVSFSCSNWATVASCSKYIIFIFSWSFSIVSWNASLSSTNLPIASCRSVRSCSKSNLYVVACGQERIASHTRYYNQQQEIICQATLVHMVMLRGNKNRHYISTYDHSHFMYVTNYANMVTFNSNLVAE